MPDEAAQPSGARPAASVTLIMPDGQRSLHPLSPGETVVGRSRQSGLHIADDTVSRRHASLVLDGQALYVEDLGSHNGTLLEGARITRRQLQDGDRLKLGNCYLEVSLDAAAPPQTAPDARPSPPPLPAPPQAVPPPLKAPEAAAPPPARGLRSTGDLAHLPRPGGLRRLWHALLWCLFGGLGLVILGLLLMGVFAGGFRVLPSPAAMGGMFLFTVMAVSGYIAMAVSAFLGLLLLNKTWRVIQYSPLDPAPARTTPGKAVGLLFIPLFALYWVFPAVWGLARDLNHFLGRHGIASRRVSEPLALAVCLAPLLAIGLGLVAAVMAAVRLPLAASGLMVLAGIINLAQMVMSFPLWSRLVQAASAVLEAKHGGQPVSGALAATPPALAGAAAGAVRFGPASQVRRFRAENQEHFRNHLKYLRVMIGEGFFPLLRLYALQAHSSQEYQYLIVLTGETAEFLRLSHSEIFLTREKEVAGILFENNFSLVSPDSSVANTAGKGKTLGSPAEFEQTLALIQAGAYGILEQHFSPEQSQRLDQAEGRAPAPAAAPPAPPAPADT